MNPQEASKKFKDFSKNLMVFDEVTVESITLACYERIRKYLEGTHDFAALAEATKDRKGGDDRQWHDTGTARDAVTKTLMGNVGRVSIETPYAPFVEFGTSRQPARPAVGTTANKLSFVAGNLVAMMVEGAFDGKYILTAEQFGVWEEAIQ